ncbi:hypothetical protein BC827DRAFT_85472 [Russula dissimulans]|nr:hypothetical protein BC827DRAFT_85472 [Russula dissimulans]
MTRVTFPNLRRFGFQGSSALLEEILPWMATPLLENFKVWFQPDQLTFPLPHLPQFLSAAEKLKFAGGSATLELGDVYVLLRLYPCLLTGKETRLYPLAIGFSRQRPGLVESSAQLFMLGSIFSAVEHLTLKYEAYEGSKVHYNNGDLTQWRNLLTSLRNVKTLRVGPLLVNELSRILQAVEELPVKILPGLRELSFPRSDNDGAFTKFAEARRIAGRPITLVDTNH